MGDEACANCHEDIYLSYHRTGMGRSVSAFDPETAPEQIDGREEIFHDRSGYYYQPFIRSDTLFQREYRKGPSGDVVYERVHRADWVVGSGNATRSYFTNVNGYITQMPLTWYAHTRQWDLSPGYEQKNHRFGRAIGDQCMTCHNGLPEFTPFTGNHYTNVPDGITCERCHGPGSEHADVRLAGLDPPEGETDPSIVNPAHLDRELQLSICQQCHLTGITVFKPGEEVASYHPGLPLSSNRSVFVIEEQLTDPDRFGIASHAARLARSACYEQSDMTCITCHNPHQPVSELEDDYFNQTCRSCHNADAPVDEPVCSREGPASDEALMAGNCVSCHLQKSGTSDIPHVTFTDHWIRPTLPPAKKPEDIERELVRPEPFTLVRVESENPEHEDPQAQLEEAIAYFQFYDTQHALPEYLPRITHAARRALAAGAEHPEGRLSLARALMEMDSLGAARDVLLDATARFPEHARLHYWLGSIQSSMEAYDDALASYRRAVDLAPAFNEARLKLADTWAALNRPLDAESEYLELIRRDSLNHPEAWNNLGFLYLNENRFDEALVQFEKATLLNPDLAAAWTNAGSILLYNEDLDRAAYMFEQALAADELYIPALGNLAQIYWQQGQAVEARSLLQRILAIQPNNDRARALLESWR